MERGKGWKDYCEENFGLVPRVEIGIFEGFLKVYCVKGFGCGGGGRGGTSYEGCTAHQ